MNATIQTLQKTHQKALATLGLGSSPMDAKRSCRQHCETQEFGDFEIDCGPLGVQLDFSFDVEFEPADPGAGHPVETWMVTGEVTAVQVSALTVRRNFADPYNCDLLNIISTDHDAALAILGEFETVLENQIMAEYESGERSVHSVAAE